MIIQEDVSSLDVLGWDISLPADVDILGDRWRQRPETV